jgi:hypothetical protein
VVKGALPQGAPTSPVMSNLVCAGLDSELRRFAAAHGCRYSRYADDLTFSTDRREFPRGVVQFDHGSGVPVLKVGDSLVRIIKHHSFTINEAKVRLRTRGQRQEVTGLVVNTVANVRREYVRTIRGMLHAWEKSGEAAAEAHLPKHYRKQRRPGTPIPKFRDVLLGRLSLLAMVKAKGRRDKVFVNLWNRLSKLDLAFLPIVDVTSAERVRSALWVLESEDQFFQGSAFMLKDYGLVTCAHCVHPDTVAYQPEKPTVRYKVRVKAIDRKKDLAILEIDGWPPGMLLPGDSRKVKAGNEVIVYGFPAYSGHGPETVTPAAITLVGIRFWVERLFLSAPIYGGNSGGPVLNKDVEVVGVAQYGTELVQAGEAPSEKIEIRHNAIALHELESLREVSVAGKNAEVVETSDGQADPSNAPDDRTSGQK